MEQHTSESFENLEPADRMKYEIAEELGLLEKVRKGGWKALSSRETGQCNLTEYLTKRTF